VDFRQFFANGNHAFWTVNVGNIVEKFFKAVAGFVANQRPIRSGILF
jgi:hypothetical protein